MTLRDLQRQFFTAISSPLPEDSSLLQPQNTAALEQIAGELIKPLEKITASERLAIYQRQYWYRLIDSLYEDFPGLRAVLGDDLFYKTVLTYIHRHRSTNPNLRNLGDRLANYVAEFEDIPEALRSAATEMSQLEWASIEAFDGRALPLISPDSIPTAPRLQPYISLLKLSYPWDEYLCEVKRGEIVRTEAASANRRAHENLTPLAGLSEVEPIFVVVHRFNSRVFYKRVSAAQFSVLKGLRQEFNLEDAITSALDLLTPAESEDIHTCIASWFREWGSLGWLATSSSSLKEPES